MTFLNKVTFLFVFCITNTFLVHPMDPTRQSAAEQTRILNAILGIIATPNNTEKQTAQFFTYMDALPIDSIREYRTEDLGNSLLHLAVINQKPMFVKRLLLCEFNLFEENSHHENPIKLAIINLERASNIPKNDLRRIQANLIIIEMICNKDHSFYDSLSQVLLSQALFLLLKCEAINDSAELIDIIQKFYLKYKDLIDIEINFSRRREPGATAFDLATDSNPYILLTFLKTRDVGAIILNLRLGDLLVIASQFPDSSLLNAILDQGYLNKTLLRDLIHDNLSDRISNECTRHIIDFLHANAPHLLATPAVAGAASDAGGIPVLTSRTRSVMHDGLGNTRRKLFFK